MTSNSLYISDEILRKPRDRLVVKANLHIYVDGLRISADFRNIVESKLINILEAARDRAIANGRKTLLPHDL